MDIGLGLPQIGPFACPDALRTVAVTAERAGVASLWTLDRLLSPVRLPRTGATLDPLVALAAAAAVTESIHLGTSALIAPLYPPVLLARSAASLDRLSDGRFTLGLGLGGSVDDHRAVGAPVDDHHIRVEEMLEVMARVWRDDVVEIETHREVVVPSTFGLDPVRGTRVPLYLAGSTAADLDRVARRADGWLPDGVDPATIASSWAHVLSLAERYGRRPGSLRMAVRADVHLTEGAGAVGGDRPAFTGSPGQIRGDLVRLADAGVHEVILDLQGTTSSTNELLETAFALADDVRRAVA